MQMIWKSLEYGPVGIQGISRDYEGPSEGLHKAHFEKLP